MVPINVTDYFISITHVGRDFQRQTAEVSFPKCDTLCAI